MKLLCGNGANIVIFNAAAAPSNLGAHDAQMPARETTQLPIVALARAHGDFRRQSASIGRAKSITSIAQRALTRYVIGDLEASLMSALHAAAWKASDGIDNRHLNLVGIPHSTTCGGDDSKKFSSRRAMSTPGIIRCSPTTPCRYAAARSRRQPKGII